MGLYIFTNQLSFTELFLISAAIAYVFLVALSACVRLIGAQLTANWASMSVGPMSIIFVLCIPPSSISL